jgi:hypothetical protein
MATVEEARAWQQEQRFATEAFQAATNGHQAVPPPIDTQSYQAATNGHQAVPPPIDTFQAATNGHQAVPPPVDPQAFQTAPRPVDTHGYQPAARPNTVAAVIDEFLEAARAGQTADLNGRPYEADQLRDMRWSLRGYVASELGELGIADLSASELREFIARLDADGFSQARTRAVVKALRALLRYAAERGMVPWNAGDLLVFGDADELPEPVPAGPVPTLTQSVLSHVNSHVQAPVAAPAEQPTMAPPAAPLSAGVPDEVIWLILKIVAIVFALIALVLVAESV